MPLKDREARKIYQREYMKKRRKDSASQRKYDSEYGRTYRTENWDMIKELNYKWRKENPEQWSKIKRRDYHNRRSPFKNEYSGVSIINTCIEAMYEFRNLVTKITLVPHHVDHIVPLSKGGLHVPWNLQVLIDVENLRKGCKML